MKTKALQINKQRHTQIEKGEGETGVEMLNIGSEIVRRIPARLGIRISLFVA